MVTAIHTIKLVGLGVTLIFQIFLMPLRKMIEQNLIICRAETPVESLPIVGNINTSGIHLWKF